MNDSIKITKSQVIVYRLRELSPRFGWADITIDEGVNAGRISISSDWGSWANYWGACGEPFKQFLCGLDIHYFAGKVGADKWVDVDTTLRQWVKQLIEERRAENIDEQKARKVYNEIKSLEDVDGSGLIYAAYEKEELGNFFDYQMSVIYGIDPSFRAFWNKAYLPFVQHLKSEMNKETGEIFSEKKDAVK